MVEHPFPGGIDSRFPWGDGTMPSPFPRMGSSEGCSGLVDEELVYPSACLFFHASPIHFPLFVDLLRAFGGS